MKQAIASSKLKIGVALGSGSARGFAHIGALKALREMGIEPHVVTGCSVGSVMGAYYAADKLEAVEAWAKEMTRKKAWRLMDVKIVPKGGFVEGHRVINFFEKDLGKIEIKDLKRPFIAVATNLYTGKEVWLREGNLLKAVRSSMALPGLIAPYFHQDKWLVDGGLVNPVPISACRALGADVVIAIDLNAHLVGRIFQNDSDEEVGKPGFFSKFKKGFKNEESLNDESSPDHPGLLDVLTGSIHIIQDRITRSRMGGDPPEIYIAPKLSNMGLLDFNLTQEAMLEGYRAVQRQRTEIVDLIDQAINTMSF